MRPLQIGHWIDGFLLKDMFIAEETESSTHTYSLTPDGKLLLRLLKKGNVMKSVTRLSGRRLRRSTL